MRGNSKIALIIGGIIAPALLLALIICMNKYHALSTEVSYDLPLKVNKTMMTDEELKAYGKYKSLIIKGAKRNKELLNDLINIDKDNSYFRAYASQDRYRYGEDAIIICEITNIGRERIIAFPLYITKLSNAYAFNHSIKTDYELTFDLTNQTYLKVLEPGDMYKKEFAIKNGVPGKYIIAISFSVPKIISLEKHNLTFDHKVIDLVDISYEIINGKGPGNSPLNATP